MDHDGHVLLAVGAAEAEFEAERELEVELHGRALVFTPERVAHADIHLGPVKGAVPLVALPLLAGGVEDNSESLFRLVPHGRVADELLGPRRQPQRGLQAEQRVHVRNELEAALRQHRRVRATKNKSKRGPTKTKVRTSG